MCNKDDRRRKSNVTSSSINSLGLIKMQFHSKWQKYICNTLSYKLLALIFVCLFLYLAYIFYNKTDDVSLVTYGTKNNNSAEFPTSRQTNQDNSSTKELDFYSWGGVVPRDNAYADLDPKHFALKESDYGGHPAFNKAMHYQVCADYFESNKDIERDLEDQRRLDPTGKSEDLALWQLALKYEECKNVSRADIQSIAELMHTAAKAGDISAQSYELDQTATNIFNALRKKNEEKTYSASVTSEDLKNLLNTAVMLAEKGDRSAAFLAAKLTNSDRFGQIDVLSSASWIIVGLQQEGENIDANNRIFEAEPYSTLPMAQRQLAIQKAQYTYHRCCSK